MAITNFPDPSASPFTAPNGVVYTWNTSGSSGYWEAAAPTANGYLKLDASNGPITGQLTFQGTTTHEDGVSVTGIGSTNGLIGTDNTDGTDCSITFGQHYIQCNTAPSVSSIGTSYGLLSGLSGANINNSLVTSTRTLSSVTGRFTGFNYPTAATPIYNYFSVDCRGTGTGTAQIQPGSNTNTQVRGFFASQTLGDTPYKAYGFFSNLRTNKDSAIDADAVNYNFYAAGTAPNYFEGSTFVGSTGTSINNDVGVQDGLVLSTSGRIGQHVTLADTNDNSASFTMWKHDSRTGTFISFNFTPSVGNGGSNLCGRIKGTSATTVNYEDTSDYRLKQNIQPLASSTELVKQLKPSTFEYISDPGVIHQGFVAHELQEICPMAVSGTKDETQVVGTLTDLDGNSEENVPEPTVVPAGSTFTATGTEEVYQGVDQRRLIPLLTKALQEALTEIDSLKARVNTLEGN